MSTSRAGSLVGSTGIVYKQTSSTRKPQDRGSATYHAQDGPSRAPVKRASRSDYHAVLASSNPVATGGGTLNKSLGQQGSAGRRGWVNRILIRFRLRSRTKPRNITSENEPPIPVPQQRRSSWLKRGLSLKEKRNKGNEPESTEPHMTVHSKAGPLNESGVLGVEESKAISDCVSPGPAIPRLCKPGSRKIEVSRFRERLSSSEYGLYLEDNGSKEQHVDRNIDYQRPHAAGNPILTGPQTGFIEHRQPSSSRKEQNDRPRQRGSSLQSVTDANVASLPPRARGNSTQSDKISRPETQENNKLELGPAIAPTLGKDGPSDQQVESQLERPKTRGRPFSLPCSPGVSHLRRDSLDASGVVKGASGADKTRQLTHPESTLDTRESGSFVQGSSPNQQPTSSKHPIADAHAREWRRRTLGGYVIPERGSSLLRPGSGCQSSRRGTSVDSLQSSYNPFDLPRIPRQPLFNDLVDLLSLSKALKNSLSRGSDLNKGVRNQTQSHSTEASRHSSFSIRVSTSNKRPGSGADWSSETEPEPGELTSSSLVGRSASGSPGGYWLAQQPSSGDDSTITDTTVASVGPLFHNFLPHGQEQDAGPAPSFSLQSTPSRDWTETRAPNEYTDKGKSQMMTSAVPPRVASLDASGFVPKRTSGLRLSRTSSEILSQLSRSSSDSSVPEAWWSNQRRLSGRNRSSYGSDVGGGRPVTPSSPRSRRMEKLSVRKRRERENNR